METTRLIEEYLEGSLSEPDRKNVEQRAATDADFRKLIDLHREVNESVSDDDLHDLHQKINTILAGYEKRLPGRYRRLKPLLRIAAVLVLIAGSIAILSTVFTNSREERLFNKYYEPYEADIITRAGDSGDKLTQAVILYNQHNYRQAYSLFSQLASSDQENYIAWFFCGITSMQMSDFENALESFAEIPDNWNNAYNEHRKWYQALALLYEKNTVLAIEKFEEIRKEEGFYADRSDAVLSSLRR